MIMTIKKEFEVILRMLSWGNDDCATNLNAYKLFEIARTDDEKNLFWLRLIKKVRIVACLDGKGILAVLKSEFNMSRCRWGKERWDVSGSRGQEYSACGQDWCVRVCEYGLL